MFWSNAFTQMGWRLVPIIRLCLCGTPSGSQLKAPTISLTDSGFFIHCKTTARTAAWRYSQSPATEPGPENVDADRSQVFSSSYSSYLCSLGIYTLSEQSSQAIVFCHNVRLLLIVLKVWAEITRIDAVTKASPWLRWRSRMSENSFIAIAVGSKLLLEYQSVVESWSSTKMILQLQACSSATI